MLGFSGQLLAWFKDYLNDRRQRVVLDNCSSGFIKVNSGVLQGSILGPLLIFYILMICQPVLNHLLLQCVLMMLNVLKRLEIEKK